MNHADAPSADAPAFVYANLVFTCSICAPAEATKADVERIATQTLGPAIGGWEAVDKSKLGLGAATPSPCNSTPGRRHWFLLDGLNAAQLGFSTKR